MYYHDCLVKGCITKAFRVGVDVFTPLYEVGSIVELRIIEEPGIRSEKIPPRLLPFVVKVKVTKTHTVPLSQIVKRDLIGSVHKTISGLRQFIGLTYDRKRSEINELPVTIIEFRYLHEREES